MFGQVKIANADATALVGSQEKDADGIAAERGRFKHGTILAGALVFIGYYLGAKLGLALTFQPHPVSAMWPPNSILLAALLLTPPRIWWFMLACALPAHLISEWQSGVPLGMILCWFASNSSEALIGAVSTRLLLGPSARFDTMRSIGVLFLCAAVLAPLLSSFLDSAFVLLNQWGNQNYWQVWRVRFCSNVFTALTLLPAIVTWGTTRFGPVPTRRVVEGSLFFLGLILASLTAFWWETSKPVAIPTLLCLPMLLLVWAAVRFGPAVTSVAILSVALLAIWDAVHGRGPFASSSPEDSVLSIQLFFVVVSTMLMLFAAALAERGKAEERFIKAFCSSPDVIIISRLRDGRVIEVNERWEKMLGYRRDEIMGRTLSGMDIYASPTDRDRCIGGLARNTLHDLELGMRTKTGEHLHTLISADTETIDGESCVILNIRDVTDQRRVVEQERARIAEDIHDDLGARLTEITLLSDLSQHHVRSPKSVRADISQIANRAQVCIESLDEIVWAVNPQQDSLESFINYLHAYASEALQLAGLRCRFELPSPPPIRPLSSKVRHNLFMACKEALCNIVKHAGATEVSTRIQLHDENLCVTITDNGRGFTPTETRSTITLPGMHGHHGLFNLRRRLESVGGRFEIKSRSGVGTAVILSVDL